MLCTKCGENVKPIVVFDIDGTISTYHRHLSKFIVAYFNLPKYLEESGAIWDGEGKFRDVFGLTQAEYRQAKLAFRQGGMKRTAPTFDDGGLTLIHRLHRAGVEIWYATTRPWERLDNVDPDTKFWLRTYHLPIDGILYDEDKYKKLITDHIEAERIIGIVDDLPEQYDAADALNLPIMQVARPHNSGPSGKRERRGTMQEVRDWLGNNLMMWKEENHG